MDRWDEVFGQVNERARQANLDMVEVSARIVALTIREQFPEARWLDVQASDQGAYVEALMATDERHEGVDRLVDMCCDPEVEERINLVTEFQCDPYGNGMGPWFKWVEGISGDETRFTLDIDAMLRDTAERWGHLTV